MSDKYTGHVPCRKCGQTHWMYGGCPPPKEPEKPARHDWPSLGRILLTLVVLTPLALASVALEQLMNVMDVVNDWLIDKGMKFADWMKRNNV